MYSLFAFPTEKGGRRTSKDCLSFPVEAGVALVHHLDQTLLVLQDSQCPRVGKEEPQVQSVSGEWEMKYVKT